MIGQEIGSDLTLINGGKVLAGIGLTLHQCGTRGYVYIAHVVHGGPASLCDTVTTDEGVQRGKIMIMDMLIAVDGITMKQGVDNIPWVREHILGDPGTIVELDLLRGDGAQFSSRYHVSLVRAGAPPGEQPSCQNSNEEFLEMQIKNLMARIQQQLERIQELETNEHVLRSLLTQRAQDLLDAETRSALRDAEARSALSDAQSLFKKELAAAEKAEAEAKAALAKAEAAAAAAQENVIGDAASRSLYLLILLHVSSYYYMCPHTTI
jgi:hypothetical protein